MQHRGDLMGLSLGQFHCSGPQRLPGGVLIPGADARMAQQERSQIVREVHCWRWATADLW